eukprot:12599705-Alexandrium_andersonii.AAC.1
MLLSSSLARANPLPSRCGPPSAVASRLCSTLPLAREPSESQRLAHHPEGPQQRIFSSSSWFQRVPTVSNRFEQFPVLPLRVGYRPPGPPPKNASGAGRRRRFPG